MGEDRDMRPPTWRSLASAGSSRIKQYISNRDLKRRELKPGDAGYANGGPKKQSWTQWAGEKIAKRAAGEDVGEEAVVLFPGWASRRYHSGLYDGREGSPYDVEVFVSGYAVKYRAPGFQTRSQKTLLKLAKTFAALPKLSDHSGSTTPNDNSDPALPSSSSHLSKSTEDLLATIDLPPRPDEIDEESEIRALRHALAAASSRNNSSGTLSSVGSSSVPGTPNAGFSSLPGSNLLGNTVANDLRRLHANLEARLHPFWAGALASRTIRISLHLQDPIPSTNTSDPPPFKSNNPYRHSTPSSSTSSADSYHRSSGSTTSSGERALYDKPLAVQKTDTAPDGSFQYKFVVPWEEVCTHPRGAGVAFGDHRLEHEFCIRAELFSTPDPEVSPQTPSPSSSQPQPQYQYQPRISPPSRSPAQVSTPALTSTPTPRYHPPPGDPPLPPPPPIPAASEARQLPRKRSIPSGLAPTLTPAFAPTLAHYGPPPTRTASASEKVPLTYSPVRVISDIDDTVKYSSVTSGARAVFYNVFVRELKENVIRGMGDWYGAMWGAGVRFHYVSNSPFELLSVINEFFQLAKLPPGSIRLRSYGTRNLFSGILSAPATRKRASVVEILSSFPHSRFILVGDSGEQDLELYASLAKDRPEQILAIFIRDVYANEDPSLTLDDPTGERMPYGLGSGVKTGSTLTLNMPRSRKGTASSVASSFGAPGTPGSGFGHLPIHREEGTIMPDLVNGSRLSGTIGRKTPRPSESLPNSPTSRSSLSSALGTIGLGSPGKKGTTGKMTRASSSDYFSAKYPAEPWESSSESSASSASSPGIDDGRRNGHGQVHTPTPRGAGQTHRITEDPLSTEPLTMMASAWNGSTPPSPALSALTLGSTESAYGQSTYGGAGRKAYSQKAKENSMSEGEKKKESLQNRVWKARSEVPLNVVLRVFREPEECVPEAEEVLRKAGVSVEEFTMGG